MRYANLNHLPNPAAVFDAADPRPLGAVPPIPQSEGVKILAENDRAKSGVVNVIAERIGATFHTFGGGRDSETNPVAHALKDSPLQFAAGVDVAHVVRFVLDAAKGAGTDLRGRVIEARDVDVVPVCTYSDPNTDLIAVIALARYMEKNGKNPCIKFERESEGGSIVGLILCEAV